MLQGLIALGAGVSAAAATTGVDDIPAEAAQGPTVVVTARRDDYAVDALRSATRTQTAVRDTPQAVTAATEAQIEDRNFRSVADVMRAVPGATAAQGEGHRDQVVLRGNNSTADFFVDGLRDDAQYYRPLYNLERIEVLRGPNAMSFGRGGGGGVVNRVTKQPQGEAFGAVAASADTFRAWSIDGDANVPLNDQVAARLNAVHERFRNHRDVFDGRLYAVNPTVRAAMGAGSIGLSYEYVDDSRVVDRGVPSRDGRPLRGYRDTFFGVDGVNRLGLEAHLVRATGEYRPSDAVGVVSRALYAHYDKFYRNVFAQTAVGGTAAAPTLGVQAYFDGLKRENLLSQTDLTWRTATGAARHLVLVGVEIGSQQTRSQRLNGFFDGVAGATMGGRQVTLPLSDPFTAPAPVFRRGAGDRLTTTEADFVAALLQDQVTIGPVEILAGIRYDRFRLRSVSLYTGDRFTRVDEMWSPRAGLVVHPIAPVSLNVSYSRSVLPQSGDQFTSLDLTGAALDPEAFENVEAGAKWAPRPGLLLAASVYRLDRTNTRAAGPNPGEVVLTGAQRSRGIELEASGRLLPTLTLSAALALQEAEIRRTTSAAPAGRDVPLVPKRQVSLWGRWDATPKLGLGLGLEHRSRQFTSISNSVALPGYARVDAALFYRLTDRLEAQVNVENLFGARYFPTAHSDNNITTGAPLNARFTLRAGL